MGIFFDAHPQDGSVRFYHEAIDGPRQLQTWKSDAEREAGKRPVMVDNPATRIPAGATEISPERFEELMAAQQAGAQIVLSRGKPITVPRAISPEEHRAARRRRRDQLLAASDWTQLPDSPLPEDVKADWREYREILRDLDMDGDAWPLAPDGEEEE
jgi:hypothetical protein